MHSRPYDLLHRPWIPVGLAWLSLHATPGIPAGQPPDDADIFACTALRAMEFSEAVGAEVRIDEPVLLPAAGDQPALCRVSGTVGPRPGFEVRMPVEGWNRRLLVTGCANDCGAGPGEGAADGLARGYATAAGGADDQATHQATLAAKAIVTGYYGEPPDWSYFRICSAGGRQGLAAAEQYPGDFDGIIVGAPAGPDHQAATRDAAAAAGADQGPEFTRFRALGGRLIFYHGWLDETPVPARPVAWWQAAERRYGAEGLADFARFYLVPGMLHCGGGPGATVVDFLTALEHWVEQDQPPAELVAYTLRDARRSDPRPLPLPPDPAAVRSSRPVHPYAEVPIYKGVDEPAPADGPRPGAATGSP